MVIAVMIDSYREHVGCHWPDSVGHTTRQLLIFNSIVWFNNLGGICPSRWLNKSASLNRSQMLTSSHATFYVTKISSPHRLIQLIYRQSCNLIYFKICQWVQDLFNIHSYTELSDFRKINCFKKSEVSVERIPFCTVIENLAELGIHCLPCSYNNDTINMLVYYMHNKEIRRFLNKLKAIITSGLGRFTSSKEIFPPSLFYFSNANCSMLSAGTFESR